MPDPTLTELLMGAGEAYMPFFRDPRTEAELMRYRHLEVWWHEHLVATIVILGRDPSLPQYTIVGRMLAWWPGTETETSPTLIEKQRYRSGNNRIDNHGYELGEIYFSRAQDSRWERQTDVRASSNGAYMRTVNDPLDDKDDVLVYDLTWDDFEAGDEVRLAIRAYFDGNTIDDGTWLRLQAVLGGLFKHPNLNTDGFVDEAEWLMTEGPSFELVQDSNEAYEGSHVLRIGPIPKHSFVVNGGFENALNSWNFNSDNTEANDTGDGPFKGDLRMVCFDGGFDTPGCNQDLDDVHPEDELYVTIHTNSSNRTIPEPAIARFSYQDEDSDLNFDDVITVDARTSEDWRKSTARYNVPSNYDPAGGFTFFVGCDEVLSSGDAWAFDEVSVIRTKGNIEYIRFLDRDGGYDSVPIVPGRRYRVYAKIRSEEGVKGEVWFVAGLSRYPGAPLVEHEYVESHRIGPTKSNRWTTFEWEFDVPSEFQRLNLHIYAQDVFGGSFWVDMLEVRDADERTWVHDFSIAHTDAETDWDVYEDTFTVPAGVQDMRVQIVAGQDGGGWNVDEFELTWEGPQALATFADMVADAIDIPGFAAGLIVDAGTISFDYTARNMTRRALLDAACRSGLVQPPREWAFRPDFTVDVGLPEEVFVDRTDADRPLILVENDNVMLVPPDASFSDEAFASRLKVIGAELVSFRGVPWVVTGEATNDVGDAVMPDGSTFEREVLLEDGSVDSRRYGDELARAKADEVATQLRSYRLSIGDWAGLGFAFDVGDSIGVFVPTESIRDDDNPVAWIDGRTIYPEVLRATSRTWTLGAGFKCKLRRGPGDVVDLTDKIAWAPMTTAEVTVGDVPRDFLANPQGGSVGRQFMRYRRATREP